MKKVKYLSLIMIMALMLTGCGSTSGESKSKDNDNNKPIAVNPPSKTGYTGVLKIVYLDPTNLNKKCTEENSDSEDETKGGCMKWYAYKEDNNSYTMILDHNTTDLVNWIKEEDYVEAGGNVTYDTFNRSVIKTDKGPITAQKQLEEDTAKWEKSLDARLIKESEIREITGNKGTGNYYFDTNTEETPYPKSKVSKYAWLIDRTTVNCKEDFGCLNNATTKGNSYWTDTAESDTKIWSVNFYENGELRLGSCVWDWWEGIRPVITVKKSNLSFVETNEEE